MNIVHGSDLVALFSSLSTLQAFADWLPLQERVVAVRKRVDEEMPTSILRDELLDVLMAVLAVSERQMLAERAKP